MSVRVDTSELDGLIRDLAEADRDAPKQGRQVVSKGALNVKDDAKDRASGLAHAPYYPQAIGYDLNTTGDVTSAEVGPDKGKRQGALGNILEYGTRNNAPIPHLGPALDDEEPRLADAAGRLGAELLR